MAKNDTAQTTEYLQQMSATNETMANMNTKFQQQLTAKDDQISQLFKQNEAILKALAKLSNDGAQPAVKVKIEEDKENAPPNRRPGTRRPNKKRKPCSDCGCFHKPLE